MARMKRTNNRSFPKPASRRRYPPSPETMRRHAMSVIAPRYFLLGQRVPKGFQAMSSQQARVMKAIAKKKKPKFERVDKPLSKEEKRIQLQKDKKRLRTKQSQKQADDFFDQDEPYTMEELNRFNRGNGRKRF